MEAFYPKRILGAFVILLLHIILTATENCSNPDLRTEFVKFLTNEDDNLAMEPYATMLYADLYNTRHKFSYENSDVMLEQQLFGNRRCKQNVVKNRLTMARSICPWHVLMTHDTERYPPTMYTARCNGHKCEYCSGGKTKKGETRRCEEIKVKVKVLRQTYVGNQKYCKDGVYVFAPYYESVAVGCTCVRIAANSGSIKSEPLGKIVSVP